jgi:hypothetical protein
LDSTENGGRDTLNKVKGVTAEDVDCIGSSSRRVARVLTLLTARAKKSLGRAAEPLLRRGPCPGTLVDPDRSLLVPASEPGSSEGPASRPGCSPPADDPLYHSASRPGSSTNGGLKSALASGGLLSILHPNDRAFSTGNDNPLVASTRQAVCSFGARHAGRP